MKKRNRRRFARIVLKYERKEYIKDFGLLFEINKCKFSYTFAHIIHRYG